MNKLKFLFLFLITSLLASPLLAQPTGESPIGQTMRSNGRIYVVVAVMLTILFGLVFYLVRLDRKMTRIEKE